jgi:hypothetical protein
MSHLRLQVKFMNLIAKSYHFDHTKLELEEQPYRGRSPSATAITATTINSNYLSFWPEIQPHYKNKNLPCACSVCPCRPSRHPGHRRVVTESCYWLSHIYISLLDNIHFVKDEPTQTHSSQISYGVTLIRYPVHNSLMSCNIYMQLSRGWVRSNSAQFRFPRKPLSHPSIRLSWSSICS